MAYLAGAEETGCDQRPGVTDLKDRLAALIAADGPMPVSAYMNACLHDPKLGYYATRPGLGTDFITAPETSQIFGELLGLWAAYEWQAMGAPGQVNLAELGPGRATLMSDALRAARSVPGFVDGLNLQLIEASPHLRAVQAERLAAFAPEFGADLMQIGTGPTLILANEYLDCLPTRQFVKIGEGWTERVVGLGDEGDLAFGLAGDAAEDVPAAPGQSEVEVQPSLDVLVDQLKLRLEAGDKFRALFIDYGPLDETPGDTLRAYQGGQQVHPLAEPGASDLTVDVDFARLKRLAEAAGLDVAGPVTQGAFLMALGAEARLNALARAEPEKASALQAGAQKLVDPAEMGERFKVICLSSPDLPMPAGF